MLLDVINGNYEFKQKDGVLYYWDIDRSKWISVFRENFYFAHKHKNIDSSIWLSHINKIPSNINTSLIKRNSIITLVSLTCEYSYNVIFKVTKNKNNINIYSLDTENKIYKIEDSLNINLEKGDNIKCFMDVDNGKIDYPTVCVEIAARIN